MSSLYKIEEFKKAKAEMKELGFDIMEEYIEYKKNHKHELMIVQIAYEELSKIKLKKIISLA